jgi:hypothetical protein
MYLSQSEIMVNVHNSVVNPWFVTGFADAEGCFFIALYEELSNRTGWQVKAGFQITRGRPFTLLHNIFLSGIPVKLYSWNVSGACARRSFAQASNLIKYPFKMQSEMVISKRSYSTIANNTPPSSRAAALDRGVIPWFLTGFDQIRFIKDGMNRKRS